MKDRLINYLRYAGVPLSAFLDLLPPGSPRDLPHYPSDPFDIYYSIPDISQRLGFSQRTIRKWVAAGKFGPLEYILRDGMDIRVPYSAIARYLQAHSLACPFLGAQQRLANLRRVNPGTKARTIGELKRKET